MIKLFSSYYKPHKKLFIIDMLCAFFMAVIDLVFPMVTRSLFNDILPNGKIRTFYILIGTLFILYILRAIFNYVVDYWGHVVGTRMEADMRNDLFSHIQTLDTKYFDETKTGHIMSRVVNDLREISELAHHGPEDLFLSVIMIIGSFIILLNIEWRLTLIIFAFIPMMIWFAIKKREKMSNAFRNVRKKIANVNSQLENSISGIRVAKSFANEEYEMRKFFEGNREFKESREFAFKSMAEFFTGINFLSNLLNLLVIAVGGMFVYRELITLGDLVAYILYINFFMQPVRRLTQFAQQFQLGMTGFERFVQILDIKPEIVDKENSIELKNVKGDIELKNITFSYNQKETVLKNINLSINAGETVALVGPSGGGKTTLCHLIPRFYDIEAGDIFIDEINIKDIAIKSLRKNIGLVQQDVFLFTGTIKDNILYGKPEATDNEVISAAKKANIHEFIMKLPNQYDTHIGEKGVKLSGGQKQRISIARVFLKNPPILILDEATSALDNESEIKIQEALEKLSKGRTTLVIAHRLSTIRNADNIVVLTDKGIQEQGNHDELMKKQGLYSRLYKLQFHNITDEIT
ncbi:ABC transporter ATP-binding protein [Paramaledivibacter caminithermalis]|uniref:ATP-binding cassette, subfamily B n=1 Tax=Paramaledivibacter caminithermalis (strain DSM 15212 / CIP 107654 / DViRD3) TaxID=1121301 RepID=A0A1M6SES3_PARC5|nr:ABC transporter ATP-binding protein [Paramaledivibacter caminithermalis]SHK43210.1 ATP-binding cassette, subfamily B [Paramaledivibacter caminithermalis DSM 15212]